jgi:hypothetical protein
MQRLLTPTAGSCREVQFDGSSVHFLIRLPDFDLWTVEKRPTWGAFHLSLTGLLALPARKVEQLDNLITLNCVFNAG